MAIFNIWIARLATDPKNIRETNIVIDGLEKRFELIQKMTWAIIALLSTLIAAAFTLYNQLGDIKIDVAILKSGLTTIKEQQSKVDESLRSLETKSLSSLTRIENRLASAQPTLFSDQKQEEPPLYLSTDEVAIVRDVLKVRETGISSIHKVGEFITGVIVPYFPPAITERIPRLKSYRYTIDQSGAVLIVSTRTGRIVEIVEPS